MAALGEGALSSQKLRDIPTSKRFFWQTSIRDQLQFVVHDQSAEYVKRQLPSHEILVLALQEIAAERARNYFFYLPKRASLTSNTKDGRLPPERHAPKKISLDYADILVMDYVWTKEDQDAFRAMNHRHRYLNAGFLTHPPSPHAPLATVQHVDRPNASPTNTSIPSIVLLSTQTTMYLTTSVKMKENYGVAKGGELLNKPLLWAKQDAAEGAGDPLRVTKKRKIDDWSDLDEISTVESLYEQLVFQSRSMLAKFTAADILSFVPHPDAAQAASVGTPLGCGQQADPPSRKREHRKREHRKRESGRSNKAIKTSIREEVGEQAPRD